MSDTKAEEFKVLVKDGETKDGKKKFKYYRIVDEKNNNKLVDTVMCKSVKSAMVDELNLCKKAVVTGIMHINNNGFEFPKAFITSIEKIEKIC